MYCNRRSHKHTAAAESIAAVGAFLRKATKATGEAKCCNASGISVREKVWRFEIHSIRVFCLPCWSIKHGPRSQHPQQSPPCQTSKQVVCCQDTGCAIMALWPYSDAYIEGSLLAIFLLKGVRTAKDFFFSFSSPLLDLSRLVRSQFFFLRSAFSPSYKIGRKVFLVDDLSETYQGFEL